MELGSSGPVTGPVLVVDDDPKIVQLLRAYLEREGFSVVTAGDGPAALAAIRDHEPRLIVLDLMLPELDGMSVARRVREDGSWGSPKGRTTTCPSPFPRPSWSYG